MLKITQPEGENRAILWLEGKLVGPWVTELRSILAVPPGVFCRILDLAGVVFVDDSGIDLLLELRQRGLELINCSEFIRGLLESRSGRAQGSTGPR